MEKAIKETDNSIIRALIKKPDDDEDKDYDFEAVAVPHENGQTRYSYQNDEYFNQVLKVSRENVNVERLESGLPLYDNHPYDNSVINTLGITTAYDFTDKGLVVRGKFGARADDALKEDIKNGIIKTVSIEGTIESYSITREQGKLPVYNAELWTPLSLSFAPVPNDIGAQIEVKRAIQRQIEKEQKPEKGNKYQQLISKFKQK